MVLVELMQTIALAIWLAAIGWRATGHGPRRGRFARRPPAPPPWDHGSRHLPRRHRLPGPLGSAPRRSRSA